MVFTVKAREYNQPPAGAMCWDWMRLDQYVLDEIIWSQFWRRDSDRCVWSFIRR